VNPRVPPSGVERAARLDDAATTVLLLCRRETGAEDAARAVRTLQTGSNLPSFHAFADQHHVLGLVLNKLERLWPEDLRSTPNFQALLKPLKVRRRLALLWDLERDRVLGALQAHNVSPLVLKGAALRLTTYQYPVERQFGDLDVLVEPAQLDAAIDGFRDAGYELGSEPELAAYRQHHFHYLLHHPRGFAAEIHWDLSRPSSPFRLDTTAFLNRARAIPRNDLTDVLTPSPEDMVLHLATQNLENNFSELRRLVDLDRIVSGDTQLDWDYTVDQARRGGLQTVLGLSLKLSGQLLGAEFPPDVMRSLNPPRYVALHLRMLHPAEALLTGYGQRRAAYGLLLTFWLTVRWRDRWAHVVGIITNRERWIWELNDPEGTPGALRRVTAVMKLIAFQGWQYLVGVYGALMGPHRRA